MCLIEMMLNFCVPKKTPAIAILIALAAFLPCLVSGQTVQFEKTDYDFGPVANGFFQPAQFRFVNGTNKKVAVLSVSAAHYVKVNYRRTFVQPGDTGVIHVTIETQKLGSFNETAKIIFSHTNKPYRLRISGEIITVQSCFPDHKNFEVREVRIVDAVTNEKIYPSSAHFRFNYEDETTVKTQRIAKTTAELPIGLYQIGAYAPGYLPSDTVRFIRKSEPIVFIPLRSGASSVELAIEQEERERVDETADDDRVDVLPAIQDSLDDRFALDPQKYTDNNIVFLVDVSLSMKKNGKMADVKHAASVLVDALRPIDRVGLITYNNTAHLLADGVSGEQKVLLHALIDSLTPKGLTNGVAGLEMAYEVAKRNFSTDGNNQVLLVTDGEFTGSQSRQQLSHLVTGNANQNIKLSIVSLGQNNDVRADLSKMAKKGGGNFIPVTASDLDSLLLQEIKRQSLIKE